MHDGPACLCYHKAHLVKLNALFFAVLGLLIASACPADPNNPAAGSNPVAVAVNNADPAGRALLQAAARLVAAYHAGHAPATNVLRVVYFVPQDGTPFPDYAARLDRIVQDVSGFYRDGLERFGIATAGLPLETKDGQLVVHLVHGKLPASEYDYQSGGRTAQEIREALAGQVDVEREFLLVFYALEHQASDGRYVFNTPYNGSGTARAGIAHVADCELLDPRRLEETNQEMVITEHYYPHLKLSVAQFNSMYLGGVAHELGHALGLPHDNGGMAEKPFGVSLMGGGNLTYREELWGGGPPTYLGRASALQLLSQPLITGSNRGRGDELQSDLASLEFTASNGAVRIQGVVTGAIPAYAVVAHAWPVSDVIDDHAARTFPGLVTNGTFTLDLAAIYPTNWLNFHLNLTRLYVNGATETERFALAYATSGVPDVTGLNAEWIVNRAEAAVMHGRADARTLAAVTAPTPEAAEKLRVLREVLDPPAAVALRAVTADSAYLSDAVWTDAQVGWGHLARNYFWFDTNIQNGVFLTLGGQFFDKGLYAHSPARFVFPVDRQWKTFTAIVGIRDGANIQGSAVFTVRGDDRVLYRSRMLRVGERAEVRVDISGVKELELLTQGGEGHNHNSWAIWAEPRVQR